MKAKLIGIFICMMLIVTPILPATGKIIKNKNCIEIVINYDNM